MFRRSLVIALLGLALPALALELQGELKQGEMLIGRVAPDARVNLDGRDVRVSPEGVFLIAFDRDAPETSLLRVTDADGGVTQRELRIQSREYDIQRIDGLPPSKVTPSSDDLKRIRREAVLIRKARDLDDARTDFLTDFIWPARGRISGVYGSQRILNGEPRRPHYGVDVAAPTGTPVVAPAAGLVTLTHDDMFFSGGTLIIDHGHGLSSAFLHLERILVEEGDYVEQGQPIAEIGATGRVTGPHLDWRMNWFDARIDPASLVPPMSSE